LAARMCADKSGVLGRHAVSTLFLLQYGTKQRVLAEPPGVTSIHRKDVRHSTPVQCSHS
jgi:hypothetical protein